MSEATGTIYTLNRSGDSRLMWNRNNEAEVSAAQAHFDALRKKGYAAYRAEGKEGLKGEVITSFDRNAERIIMVPQVSGGC